MNIYEAKKQARIDRLRQRAERLTEAAATTFDRAKDMASIIPFGQPILVGHHSEKGDRAYRGRITRTYEKSFELMDAAKAAKAKAWAAECNDSISSDDPDAPEKLATRIAKLEANQKRMVATNRLIRGGLLDALPGLGYSPQEVEALLKPDTFGYKGFAPFELANASANIRRLKQRLQQLQGRRARPERPPLEFAGGEVRENREMNRLQILFASKPDKATRDLLKSYGFRWAPTEEAWQTHLSPSAHDKAKLIISKLEGAS